MYVSVSAKAFIFRDALFRAMTTNVPAAAARLIEAILRQSRHCSGIDGGRWQARADTISRSKVLAAASRGRDRT